jgi:hypothetical protein
MPLTTSNIAELKEAGCELADPPLLFLGLMQATRNDPCNGCCYFNDGKCPAYLKFHSVPLAKNAGLLKKYQPKFSHGVAS